MRKLILMLSLVPFFALAQNNSGMSEDMMKMMEQAQKAQACMQDIDTSEFEKIEQESKQIEAEVKSLCASGKRDEAQKKGLAYSRELMSRPAVQKIRECSELLRGMIPELPFDDFENKIKNKNICDEMK